MMSLRHTISMGLATAIVLARVAAPASALDPAGDANLGHAYAKTHCAECHSIEAGAKSSLVIAATPFAQLTKAKRLTAKDINGWLRASHASMSIQPIPAENRADLVAYIKSLALR